MKGNLFTTTTVELFDEVNETLHEYEISWEFSPYDPGRITGPPEACYPPEGGECWACNVEGVDGDGEEWLRNHGFDYGAEEERAFNDAHQEWHGDEDR